MTVRLYRSSDTSAPVLLGNTAGQLISLLNACLVTGYGARVAAGWTMPFTGTNIAAFRQGTPSNGMYFRIDDTSVASGARAARMLGYETMTGVSTSAVDPFPNNAQWPGGLFTFTKNSASTAATPRRWTVIADQALVYLFISTHPDSASTEFHNSFFAFGDTNNYRPNDLMGTIIMGHPVTSEYSSQPIFNHVSITSSTDGVFMARRFDQLSASARHGLHADGVKGGNSFGGGALTYPHGPDGGLYMSPVFIHDPIGSTQNIRGILPGMWSHLHPQTIFNEGDTFSGQGAFAGRTFQVLRGGSSSTLIVETSNTWR